MRFASKSSMGKEAEGRGWGQAAPSPGSGKHQVLGGTALKIKARLGLCFGINVRDLLPNETYFIHDHPLQQLVGDDRGPLKRLGFLIQMGTVSKGPRTHQGSSDQLSTWHRGTSSLAYLSLWPPCGADPHLPEGFPGP